MNGKIVRSALAPALASLLFASCAGFGGSGRSGGAVCADRNVVCRCEVLCVPCDVDDTVQGPVDAYVADVAACCDSQGVVCPPCPDCGGS